jgi:site-specific DNA-methyltransferase (adenine-specific)
VDSSYIVNDIIQGDSSELSKYVKPNSVSLTITSPPYRNAIDYSQHVTNLKQSKNVWMRGTGTQTTENYMKLMEKIFNDVYKVTKEGGFCCIIIGDEVVNGKLLPLPSLFLERLCALENDDVPDKWRFRDMIIWNKVTSGRNGAGNRFGLFTQYPIPTYFRANIMHEYIIILQKGKARSDISIKEKERVPLNRIMKREIANSIWNIAPVPPGSINHPVPFPEQIPFRLITLYSKKGDVVLDPMNGSGQTTKVANQLGRKYIGIDIRQEYVNEAKNRLSQELKHSNILIPVYHVESWEDEDQIGYFETREIDLSKNIPAGYKFLLKTESDRSIKGQKGIYAYYQNQKSNYLCFIVGANGKLNRLNLGTLDDPKSMLYNVLANLPKTEFIKADLNNVLETRIVENRQPVKACMDILEHHFKYVKSGNKIASKQYFEMTVTGKKAQEKIKKKVTKKPIKLKI